MRDCEDALCRLEPIGREQDACLDQLVAELGHGLPAFLPGRGVLSFRGCLGEDHHAHFWFSFTGPTPPGTESAWDRLRRDAPDRRFTFTSNE